MKIASGQAELDGWLMDYAAKGTKTQPVGIDKVDDRDTYKVKLTTKDGNSLHAWIDAKTFLEAKIERAAQAARRRLPPRGVSFRDYRQVNGLVIPLVLETRGPPLRGSGMLPLPWKKSLWKRVEVNPKLDPSAFCEADGLSRIEKAPVLRHQARAQIRASMQLSEPNFLAALS